MKLLVWMEENGVTVRELSETSGVSARTINAMRSGTWAGISAIATAIESATKGAVKSADLQARRRRDGLARSR